MAIYQKAEATAEGRLPNTLPAIIPGTPGFGGACAACDGYMPATRLMFERGFQTVEECNAIYEAIFDDLDAKQITPRQGNRMTRAVDRRVREFKAALTRLARIARARATLDYSEALRPRPKRPRPHAPETRVSDPDRMTN